MNLHAWRHSVLRPITKGGMAFFFLFVVGILVSLGALVVAFLRVPVLIEKKLRAETTKKKPGVWNKRHPALKDLKLLPNTAARDKTEVKLKVKIIEATGLAPAEKNGSSDAYVRLSFGGQSRKTKFIPKSLHPHVRHESKPFFFAPEFAVVILTHASGMSVVCSPSPTFRRISS